MSEEVELREPDVPTSGVFRCDVCGRKFANPPALKAHARSHPENDDEGANEDADAGLREQPDTGGEEVSDDG